MSILLSLTARYSQHCHDIHHSNAMVCITVLYMMHLSEAHASYSMIFKYNSVVSLGIFLLEHHKKENQIGKLTHYHYTCCFINPFSCFSALLLTSSLEGYLDENTPDQCLHLLIGRNGTLSVSCPRRSQSENIAEV